MTATLRRLYLPTLLLAGAVGGCDSLPSMPSDMGSTLGNMFRAGSSAAPVARAAPANPATYCPAVLVIDGQSSVRRGSAQISIANVARECFERAGGGTTVRVGVEGRALLGPGGGAGRFDVPVSFLIKSDDRVVVSRVKNVAVSIPPNEAQGSFIAIESDIVVPANTGSFEIEVGLGGGGAARRRG